MHETHFSTFKEDFHVPKYDNGYLFCVKHHDVFTLCKLTLHDKRYFFQVFN